jgi:hypothetical protein
MSYNGYPNYNLWNVSLWINNDEGLYNAARELARTITPRRKAAIALRDELRERGIYKTPDGAPYTIKGIVGAMRGMD